MTFLTPLIPCPALRPQTRLWAYIAALVGALDARHGEQELDTQALEDRVRGAGDGAAGDGEAGAGGGEGGAGDGGRGTEGR